MEKKALLRLQEKIKQLPLEGQLKLLKVTAKKEKQKEVKDELQKTIDRLEQHLMLLAQWKQKGPTILEAMQKSQQPTTKETVLEKGQRQEAM